MAINNESPLIAPIPLQPLALEGKGRVSLSSSERTANALRDSTRESKNPGNRVRTPFLKALIQIVKTWYPKYGRTRIRKEISEAVPGSERTIGRILRELDIQNPQKRLGPPVQVILTIPKKLLFFQESVSLSDPGNAKIILPLIYRDDLGSKLRGKVSEKTYEALEKYTFALLANERLSHAQDATPPTLTENLYAGKPTDSKIIRQGLVELGTDYRALEKLVLPKETPTAIAVDEKVVEKWHKKNIEEVQTDNPSLGNHYVSRRSKAMPSVSTDVAAVIDEKGTARAFHFQATPASHKDQNKNSATKKSSEKVNEPETSVKSVKEVPNAPKKIIEQKLEQKKTSGKRKTTKEVKKMPKKTKKRKITSTSQSKRLPYIIALLETIFSMVGMVPLRMDNGYGQKAVVKWLITKGWPFIVHGKSNLKIARPVKNFMLRTDQRYYKERIFEKEFGGWLSVVGYLKRGRVYIYLTNEEGSAKEIITRYRHRWRIENLFKWCPCLANLPGIDPNVHNGHQFLVYYLMAPLVHQFHASLPTINRLLSQPSQTTINGNQLIITFPRLSSHYYHLLRNFVSNLPPHWKAQILR